MKKKCLTGNYNCVVMYRQLESSVMEFNVVLYDDDDACYSHPPINFILLFRKKIPFAVLTN